MNICMATDENYAFILKVAVLSVIKNNRDAKQIVFHILEDGVSGKRKREIINIVKANGRDVKFYNVSQHIDRIKKAISNAWADANSYLTYARLYFPEFLDKEVERILYLDCDTLVVDTLQPLFEMDMGEKSMAAVKDILPYVYKKSKGMENGEYFNAGVLLIDCQKWREKDLTNKLLEYCFMHKEDAYPDQDALNILLHEQILCLSPGYCVFYPENAWDARLQIKGHGNGKTYYSERELDEARNNPKIIHYVDTVLGRPWQINNINPYAGEWIKYYNMLPQEEKAEFKGKVISKRQHVFRWMYKILPGRIFAKIYYRNRNIGIAKKIKRIERHEG